MTHRWVLPNGLTLLYQSSPALPLAAGTLLLRTGSLYESPRQAGLANLAVELLLQGTRRHSAEQLADKIESVGASLGTQTSDDYVEIGWAAPAQKLGSVLEVLLDLLTQPRFAPSEITKEKAEVLASLSTRYDTLFNIAHDPFNALLFGGHPYGRLVEGRIDTVKRFTRRELLDWHKTWFDPKKAIVSIVAPQSFREGQSMLEKYFHRWDRPASTLGRTPSLCVSALERSAETKIKASFEQAYLMTGMLAPAISEPGYAALKVLNTLFGGGMSSRLFLELREKMGLAYEVSSFFPTRIQKSQWVLYMGLPPDKLDVARKKMNDLLAELVEREVSKNEVDQARKMIRGSFLMENQTRRRQAWYAAWGEFLGQGPDFARAFLTQIDAVTPGEIRAVAKGLLGQPRVTVEVTPR